MIQIIAKLDELIISFQLQLKSLTHMISQKTSRQVFHSNEHKCVRKNHFVEKLLSFERWQELCCRLLYQNSFCMFIKMLDEIKEKLLPKYTKIYQKTSTFSCLKQPPCSVFSPLCALFNNCLNYFMHVLSIVWTIYWLQDPNTLRDWYLA